MIVIKKICSHFKRNYFFQSKRTWHLNNNRLSANHLYHIVDIASKHDYLVYCSQTQSSFNKSLSKIVFDLTILYNLPPIQACAIGLAYAQFTKKNGSQFEKLYPIHASSYPEYGVLKVQFQTRNGDIGYINTETDQCSIVDPRQLVVNEHLIGQFHAQHAFHIGFHAGLKINKEGSLFN